MEHLMGDEKASKMDDCLVVWKEIKTVEEMGVW